MMPESSDRPSRSTRRTWISVLIATVVIVGFLAIAAVGGTAYFFYRHIHASFTPPEDADSEFAQARARFAGQQPLIEIQGRDQVIVHRTETPSRSETAKLRALHAMVYDPSDGRMVDVNVPFWVLRLAPSGGRFSFLNDRDFSIDSDRVRLTLDDLEHHGPGLILDHHDPRGSVVLVWTE